MEGYKCFLSFISKGTMCEDFTSIVFFKCSLIDLSNLLPLKSKLLVITHCEMNMSMATQSRRLFEKPKTHQFKDKVL